MTRLELLCYNVKKLNAGFLLKQLFLDSTFRDFILSENRYSQLADEGIDSDGNKLRSAFAKFGRAYADRTIQYKQDKSGIANITDHVTLYDEGNFYKSFKLDFDGKDYYILAETIKEDTDLQEVWGDAILGLTNKSLQNTINLSLRIIIPLVKKTMLP